MKTSNKVEARIVAILDDADSEYDYLIDSGAGKGKATELFRINRLRTQEALLDLIEAEKALVLEEVLGKLPKVSKFNSRGGLRPFSTKDVWDYGDVYTKAEANYKAKVTQIIKGVNKEIK